jgi:GNAT superfamily N-acetyltransferase
MSARTSVEVRLEPMSEADFRESVRRSISRHAADYVRRGLWSEKASLEAMEKEFARLLPNGRETPDRCFANVVDSGSGRRVGETWYTAQEQGGRIRFWVDWIWIDSEHRRKGYATATLLRLEGEALKRGADRIGLSVWFDNPDAIALYSKLGYAPASMWMLKLLDSTRGQNSAISRSEGTDERSPPLT